MTRSFGDFYLKQQHSLAPDAQAVVAVPDVLVIDRHRENKRMHEEKARRSANKNELKMNIIYNTAADNTTPTSSCIAPNDDYHYYLCLLACDGLWDVFASHEALSFLLFAAGRISATRDSVVVEEVLALACDALVLEAMRRGARDNISCVATLVPTTVAPTAAPTIAPATSNTTAASVASVAPSYSSMSSSASSATSSSSAMCSSVSSQWHWPVVLSTFAPPVTPSSLPAQNSSISSSATNNVVNAHFGSNTLSSASVRASASATKESSNSGSNGANAVGSTGLCRSASTNTPTALVSNGEGEQENQSNANNSKNSSSNDITNQKNTSSKTSSESGEAGGSAKTRARKRGAL